MSETNIDAAKLRAAATRAIDRRSFATLATVSPAGHPHAAGVIYAAVGTTLYVSTDRSSRKARNVAANPRVGVTIPVRRLPVGPPATVQFQGTADILAPDEPDLTELMATGRLKAVTSHGELERPDICFLRITPARRITAYGVGMSLLRVMRDPLNLGGSFELAPAVTSS
jgi:general stress protein 26